MFEYECLCPPSYKVDNRDHPEYHHNLCKLWNLRRDIEQQINTGITKHWREVEEIERLENALSRLKSST